MSGTKEWADYEINIQTGCPHNCHYCFAKCNAVRFKRRTAESWAKGEIRAKEVAAVRRKRPGRGMFPTSHDITPDNLDEALTFLRRMFSAGNELLVVSKPHLECVRVLCRELTRWREQVMFRFTVGSADDRTLHFWEPGAPTFRERLASLQHAHGSGYRTSISCEPMLDGEVHRVVDAVRPHVTDSAWLGRVNRLRQTLAINCPGDAVVRAAADRLLAEQSDEWVWGLYRRFERDPLIKWKDSIKEVVGLARPTERGLDA